MYKTRKFVSPQQKFGCILVQSLHANLLESLQQLLALRHCSLLFLQQRVHELVAFVGEQQAGLA